MIMVSECLAILFVSVHASSDFHNCFDEYCFTYPGANVTLSFDNAWSWCSKNDSSTLAVVSNKSSQDALISFRSSSNIHSPLYINAKLDKNNGDSWYFVTGEHFEDLSKKTASPVFSFTVDGTDVCRSPLKIIRPPGTVENQGSTRDSSYEFYTFLQMRSQEFSVCASSPQEPKNYICQYADASELNILPNTRYDHNGSIYIKYENETLNWFEARNKCHLKGGDLATFSNLSDFKASWLNLSYSYWVGFRWNNWRWKTMDNGLEIIYTRWSNGRPNNSSLECVCIDESSSWNWTDCDCSIQRSFVCAKYRNISTTASTTTILHSAASDQTFNGNSENSIEKLKLPIGVAVGVGGGVLITLVVVVIIIVIKMRKRKQSTTGPTKTKNEGKPHKKPKSPKKPKETKVTKPTDNFPEYADIQAVSQPGRRDPTKEPVVYSTPEFVETN